MSGRLVPRTLRWRLALAVAGLIAISFCITFVVVYDGTGSAMRAQIDRELQGDAQALMRALGAARADSPRRFTEAAIRYVENQPFRPSSTLLWVSVPGRPAVTNEPELLGMQSRPDSGETPTQQADENRAAGAVLRAPAGYSTVALPDVGGLRLVHRTLALNGAAGIRTVGLGVGEPLAPVATAQAGVARAFILAGILVLIGALAGAFLLGTRFSAPLRRMASVAARVAGGDLHPRIHDPDRGAAEVRVLADSFNHMLDRLTAAFGAQRAFVADASHELRTPLTVLRGQIELLLTQDRPSPEELQRVGVLLQAEIARMARLVDDLLELARAERPEDLRIERIALRDWLPGLWESMRLLAERRFELGAIPDGTLRADPDRLAQALRNVVANAVEHTAAPDGVVRLGVRVVNTVGGAFGAATADDGRARGAGAVHEGRLSVVFAVEDDGPGIPRAARERVFERFQRTDQARDRRSGGAGLGLPIVRAIAEAHGGRARAGSSRLGGACVEIELPGFRESPSGAGRPEGSAHPAALAR